MIDLTMDEVSDGETAPETPSVQRQTRSGIVQTARASYEPKIEKDTKTPRKLIKTQNVLENRLENRPENRFENESSGPSRPKHSKPMKLWNGKKDEQERENYEREKCEREKSEREIELKNENDRKNENIERKKRAEQRIRIEEQQRLEQRMIALENSTTPRYLQEENHEFRRSVAMIGLRYNDPQNPSLFVKSESPTRFSGELDENDEEIPDFSGGARNPFEVNYGYKWFENNSDGTRTVVRKCVKRVLDPENDRKEIDILAMERLDEDNGHVLKKVDTLMDNLTRPLEDAMASYGKMNEKYIRGQEGGKLMSWVDFEMLVILEKTITADLLELEKEICSKF